MQSKRSLFNRTLFRKNLTRFWPLWGGVSLAGSLMPLYILLELMNRMGDVVVTREDFSYLLYSVATLAVPAVSFGYAIVCAMLVWSYLYTPRSVGLMHTLPVDRTCLFLTSALSGLAMMLIPYAIVGALTCLIALFWGFFDAAAVGCTILAVLLMTVAFFGLATFCAMLTGHVFALPVLYLLVNFLAPLLEMLLVSLTSQFLVGLTGTYQGVTTFLSPLINCYENLSVEYIWDAAGNVTGHYLAGFPTLAVYGLAGLALLGLGWLLYRLRRSESAGDVAAFRALRPVFRWGLALLSALTLGWLLYQLFWASFHTYDGYYAAPVPMAVCMALTALLGWYVASMLLEKSLRVFRGTWRSAIAVCVGACALCALVSVDVFGLEDRIPDMEDIAAVSLSDYGLEANCYAESDAELVEKVLNLHRAIIADKAELRSAEAWNGRSHSLRLSYTLKDNTYLTRYYFFGVDSDLTGDLTTLSGRVADLYRDPRLTEGQFAMPEGAALTSVSVYDYDRGYGEDLAVEGGAAQAVYDAAVQDAREGNIPGPPVAPGDESDYSYNYHIDIEYRLRTEEGVIHRYNGVELYPTMTHTIDALIKLDLLTETRVEEMNRVLAERS